MILVSACLMGHRVRYDGRHSRCDQVRGLLAGEPVLALCPEVLGGLGTPGPRPASWGPASAARGKTSWRAEPGWSTTRAGT